MEGKKVILTYFKRTGKYYSSGDYITYRDLLQDIWEEVMLMQKSHRLPGLILGSSQDFIVLVNVPDHEYDHPILLL